MLNLGGLKSLTPEIAEALPPLVGELRRDGLATLTRRLWINSLRDRRDAIPDAQRP